MRLLMSGLTLFVALCLLAPATIARAPKPPMFTAASVQFRDWPGDEITSDGVPANQEAPYVDGGQRGLEVRLWINGSQDLTIGTFASGRTIRFSYTPVDRVSILGAIRIAGGQLLRERPEHRGDGGREHQDHAGVVQFRGWPLPLAGGAPP